LEASQTGERHDSKRAAEMPGWGQRGKPKAGFPSQPTSPWKSPSRFPHSRSPGHDRHGKGEIQKQDSHFPTATSLSQSNKSKTKGDQPQPKTLSFRLISGLEYANTGRTVDQKRTFYRRTVQLMEKSRACARKTSSSISSRWLRRTGLLATATLLMRRELAAPKATAVVLRQWVNPLCLELTDNFYWKSRCHVQVEQDLFL
jgi:hypothetical protein